MDAQEPTTSGRRRTVRLLSIVLRSLRLVRRAARRELGWSAAAQVVAAAATAAALVAGRRLLEELQGGGSDAGALVPVLAAVAAATFVGAAAGAAESSLAPVLSTLVEGEALRRIVARARAADYEDYLRPAFLDDLRRSLDVTLGRTWQLVSGTLALGRSTLAIGGVALVIASIYPLALVALVVGAVPLWLLHRRLSAATYRAERSLTTADREAFDLLTLLTGRPAAAELRVLGAGAHLERRRDLLFGRRVDAYRRLARLRIRRLGLGAAVLVAATVVVSALVVREVDAGRLTIPDAVTLLAALGALSASGRTLIGSLGALVESALLLDDTDRFLGAADGAGPPAERRPDDAAATFATLRLRGVATTYPGAATPALAEVDLDLRPGEVVLVVGPNGSGKTTLAKTICRLLRPSAGTIEVDGADAATLDDARWRALVAAVFHQPVRYPASAADNIGFGWAERLPDDEGVAAAAEASGTAPLVRRLPAGLETLLTPELQGGVDLSAGQWQRVALARALFARTPLLVLDEPTASLDAEAEAEVLQGLRALASGRAVVLVSHRPRSVGVADRVVVLEAGRIAADGSPADVAGRSRWFRTFVADGPVGDPPPPTLAR